MNRRGYGVTALLLVVAACYGAEKQSLVAPGAEVEKLAGGFAFIEGPAADSGGDIYFSDIPNNRIHRWFLSGQLDTFRENSGGANGLFFDIRSNLLACEGGGRRLVSISPSGERVKVLADSYEGKRFNSLNDLWIDPRGGIYFTDPRYGGRRDDMEQDGEHVYYLAPDRKKLIRVIDDMVRPNGVVGTPDGRTLYVADHGAGKTFSYAVNEDGTLSDKKLFAPEGSDGMTIDNEGNIYLTTGVVAVYNKKGEKIEEIKIPERPSNVCFGGKDRRTLFITARTSLYSIEMRVKAGQGIFYEPIDLGHIPVTIQTPSLTGRALPELRNLRIELPAGDVDKMVLVCFFDVEQRPSRRFVQALAERAGDSTAERVEVVCVQTTDVDEMLLKKWVTEKNIPFPIGGTSAGRGTSSFEWGVKSLPWLILTDRMHIVVAEGFGLGDVSDHIMRAGTEPKFEQDVVRTDAGDLRIVFIGHGTLMLTFRGEVIHVDPVSREADYSTLPKADLILLTHEHGDHLDAKAIAAIRTSGETQLVLTQTCAERIDGGFVMKNGQVSDFGGLRIEAVPAYNIVHKRSDGQPFHPKGQGNGYLITFGDKRVYVAGDTEDTPEMKSLKNIDVAFLPMNLPYTMTPEMVADAARAFKPKVLYPYHYGQTDPNKLVDLLKDSPEIEVRIRKMQ